MFDPLFFAAQAANSQYCARHHMRCHCTCPLPEQRLKDTLLSAFGDIAIAKMCATSQLETLLAMAPDLRRVGVE